MNKKLNLQLCIYAILTTMAINTGALGQDSPLQTIIKLDRQSSSIESILKQISEEYAITFSYGNKNIALAKKVNLQVDKRPLSEVLNSLFEDSEIQYELVGDQVVLTKEYVEETVVVKQPQKPKTKRVVEKKVYVNKPITKNQKMDTIILRAMEWHKIPGLGVGIVKDNKVLFAKGYGVTDLKKKVAVDENTFFPMIWFSQTVAVVAIMQQVEKGTIVLDEKVTTYLDDFKLKDKKYKDITIRHLLSHTSGLKDQKIEWNDKKSDPTQNKKLTKKKIDEPGKINRYTSINYVFLARILEEITGLTYEEYVQKNIFDPMGMTTSSFEVDEKNKDNYVSQHIWWRNNQINKTYPHSKSHLVSHGWQANVKDLTKWALLHANHGTYNGKRIISKASLDEVWSEQFPVNDFLKRDRVLVNGHNGFIWTTGVYRDRKVVLFSSGISGIYITMLVCPEDNIAVFAVANNLVPANFPALGLAYAALDIYNPNYSY